MLLKSLPALLLVMALAACDESAMMAKWVPHDEDVAARGYLDAMRKRDFDAIEKDIDPSQKGPTIHATLEKMADLMAGPEPISVKVVGSNTLQNSDSTTTDLTYEFEFPGKWIRASVITRKTGTVSTIVGVNVAPLSDSIENLNRFTLEGKTSLQYIMLSLGIVAVLFSLVVLVICARTKLKGRKWPWILFIIVSIGNFTVNWTTAQMAVNPLAIHLFSLGAHTAPYAPWIVTVSIPLGAITFLIMRRKLTRQPEPEGQPAAPDNVPT